MTSTFLDARKAVEERWNPGWKGDFLYGRMQARMHASLNAVADLLGDAETKRKSGKYTKQGLADEVRAFAKTKTAPVLIEARKEVEYVRGEVRRRKSKLVRPTPDPGDVTGAILRSEMRTWMRSRPMHETIALLLAENADERLLEAALEVPPQMAGLTAEVKADVESHLLQQRHSDQLSRIDELAQAAELLSAAVEIGLYQLRQEAGFGENDTTAFDSWMQQASAAANCTETHEAQQRSADHSTDWIRETIDEEFAKAFPTLYPDHPVNQLN